MKLRKCVFNPKEMNLLCGERECPCILLRVYAVLVTDGTASNSDFAYSLQYGASHTIGPRWKLDKDPLEVSEDADEDGDCARRCVLVLPAGPTYQ